MVLYRQIEWSLFSCMGLMRRDPIPYMRPVTILSVYTTSWSLLTNSIHENRDHSLSIQHHGLFSPILFMTRDDSICLYNTMVSSHQSHAWEQGPFYLSIQHHGLFSQIICMKPGTVTGLIYGIGEKRPWCCIDREWSLVSCMAWDWWEEIMMLHRQIEWSMVSWI
jgi:hypothetical protein